MCKRYHISCSIGIAISGNQFERWVNIEIVDTCVGALMGLAAVANDKRVDCCSMTDVIIAKAFDCILE